MDYITALDRLSGILRTHLTSPGEPVARTLFVPFRTPQLARDFAAVVDVTLNGLRHQLPPVNPGPLPEFFSVVRNALSDLEQAATRVTDQKVLDRLPSLYAVRWLEVVPSVTTRDELEFEHYHQYIDDTFNLGLRLATFNPEELDGLRVTRTDPPGRTPAAFTDQEIMLGGKSHRFTHPKASDVVRAIYEAFPEVIKGRAIAKQLNISRIDRVLGGMPRKNLPSILRRVIVGLGGVGYRWDDAALPEHVRGVR